MKIVADEFIPYVRTYFSSYGDLVLKDGRSIIERDVYDADILLVRSITPVNEALLKHSNVKFVGSVTAGADHLDMQWLKEAGIAFSTAAGFNAPPVADYIVSVIAALQRKHCLGKAHETKVAVVGVGHVGRLVVDRLNKLGFSVLLCDPLRAKGEQDFDSIPIEELDDCDLITLHVPLTMTGEHPTYHMVDKKFLRRQKADCIFVNTSRGSVVNSTDLLQEGEHLHWCLDVWEKEPTINKAVMQQALIATPHIAGYSIQGKIRGIDMIYRLACEKKIITPRPISPLEMPHQLLAFAGHHHHWQDIVLGIFNPLVMTAVMKETLSGTENGVRFDQLRNQFNYRYEFAFTTVATDCSDKDQYLLSQLGIHLKSKNND